MGKMNFLIGGGRWSGDQTGGDSIC